MTEVLDTAGKQCRRCEKIKPLDKFTKNSRTSNGKRSRCTDCVSKYNALYYENNKDKHRESSRRYRENNKEKLREQRIEKHRENPDIERNSGLKKNYGITLVEFNEMLQAQGGKCALCETDEPGGKGAFHVDHDHKTGVIRGLLCAHCNTGIGKLGDTIEGLEKALDYLRRTSV